MRLLSIVLVGILIVAVAADRDDREHRSSKHGHRKEGQRNRQKPTSTTKAPTSTTKKPKVNSSIPPAVPRAMLRQSRDVDAALDRVQVGNASLEFGIRLFSALANENHNKNVFMSPFSLSVGLSMSLLGAKGKTRNDMAETLRLSGFADKAVADAYEAQFHTLTNSANVTYKTANALYFQDGLVIQPTYYDLMKSSFKADVTNVDFHKQQEVKTKINSFIENATTGFLKNTLTKPLSTDTVFALINAVYFKGQWSNGFNPNHTSVEPFKLNNGSTVNVKLMKQSQTLPFMPSSKLDAKVVEIPYQGKEFSMIVVVPHKTLNQTLSALTPEIYSESVNNLTPRQVTLSLPKFELDARYDLKEQLQKMGMSEAFSARADFSGISNAPNVCLSKVVHQARVSVDEAGTVAAAATVVAGNSRTAALTLEVKADHPFVFFIRHIPTQQVVFMGLVTDPTSSS